MHKGKEPASHTLARRLIQEGYDGIIVPSFAKDAGRDGLNLVLWNWHIPSDKEPRGALVHVLSDDLLPKDQSSWR